MVNALSTRPTGITTAFSAPKAPAPAAPAPAPPCDQVSLGHSLLKNVVGVASKAVLVGATAATGWLGGPSGLLAATVGGALGYGVYAASIGETDLKSMGQASVAGTVVGCLGGLAGKAFGMDGVIVMGSLGACGSIISRACNWAEGWTQDGHYRG